MANSRSEQLTKLLRTLSSTTPDIEAAAGTEVLTSQDPALVPLETLSGRDHYAFPAGETPPWQWHVEPRYPGWLFADAASGVSFLSTAMWPAAMAGILESSGSAFRSSIIVFASSPYVTNRSTSSKRSACSALTVT